MNKVKQKCSAVAVALLMLAIGSAAQAEPGAQEAAPRPVVVHAARLLHVRSGRILTDQIIVIENGHIVSITSSAEGIE